MLIAGLAENDTKMFNIPLANDFALYIMVFFLSIVLYIWFVYMPYAKFPACRLEHRIPYWIYKRVRINYAFFQTIIEQAKQHESEGVFAVWLGVPYLFVYGESIIKKIVCEHAANDKPKCYKQFEFAFGKSILTRNGEEWKKQFKMTAPAFHVSAFESYAVIINEHSEEMIERLSGLSGQPTHDIVDIISFCAIGIIVESNLGEKEKNAKEYIDSMQALNVTLDFAAKRQWSPWLYFDFSLKLFPSARKVNQLVNDQLEKTIKPRLEKIKKSLEYRQASPHESDYDWNGKRFKPFGESIVLQHLQDPTITMDEMARQITVLVSAGFDTVTHSLKFALLLLGLHSDVQDRAYQEVMSETEGSVTYEDQRRLVYLECVIKEALRLYPIVPIFGRCLTKDLQCGKYKLPKNSTLVVFPYMLHRNPEVYPDPEKFDPERFRSEHSKITPWNFVPFADGTRPCIGKNFAMVEMKIILAHVLRNFRIISLDKIEEKDLTWSIIIECNKKFRMQFLPRT